MLRLTWQVRIGTAKYRQVENFSEVNEALANWTKFNGDIRIILFINLKNKIYLTTNYKKN